jgi:peptidoglycan/xylan/chitin deacetylase (PgdA/CDA1 family)
MRNHLNVIVLSCLSLDHLKSLRYSPTAMIKRIKIGWSGTWFLVLIMLIQGCSIQGSGPTDGRLPTTTTQPIAQAFTNTPTTQPSPTQTLPPPPVNTDTPTATHTPTGTPSNTPTHTPTATPTDGPSPTPTDTPKPPPLPTPFEHYSWTLKVPILMYHYISIPPEDADEYRLDLSVTPDNFRTQLTYLAENGYNTIDFYDLSLAIVNKRELPPNPIIITMDDGYRDNYENAYPILQAFGMKATIFIVTEFIDSGNPNYLTWEMVEEMSANGIRFEVHSRTHPDLRDRERDFLIWEILGPQETIAAHIGYTPRYFAYPGGRYDQDVIDILAELDFWAAVTTVPGKWHGYNDRFEWTRMRIRNTTAIPEFADLVE